MKQQDFDEVVEHQHGEYLISTDKRRLDVEMVHDYLCNESYWANGRSLPTVQKSIENALCFGLYHHQQQVGFARVVTDYATFGWLCDVFILEAHRGQGLSKRLVQSVVQHPELMNMNRMILATGDAHELYSRYGNFQSLPNPGKWMIWGNIV
ncbi:MAG: GNAT family N-acetyltransferase [Chloroflexota bacterium]